MLILSTLIGCNIHTSYQDISGIVEVDYEMISQLMNDDVSFLLYVGRDDCGDCIEFYPILEDYMNHHSSIGIYYLNIRQIRDQANEDDATKEEKEFFENIYEYFQIEWTPIIEWIRNGKIYKKYQFLDENYINIENREEQKEKRKEYLQEFEDFMKKYEEKYNEEMSKM